MTERQRELSRTVVPLIQTTMTPGYERGFAEKGSGSHARRVAVVEQHLQSNKGSMYVCLSSLLILSWHSFAGCLFLRAALALLFVFAKRMATKDMIDDSWS